MLASPGADLDVWHQLMVSIPWVVTTTVHLHLTCLGMGVIVYSLQNRWNGRGQVPQVVSESQIDSQSTDLSLVFAVASGYDQIR